MNGHWFRINSSMLHRPELLRLSSRQYRRKFLAAMRGTVNEFAPFVKPCRAHPAGPEWKEIRASIFKRDNYTCGYCGERGGRLECDHVIPVSRGGSDHHSNLLTACFQCNRSKWARLPEEWRSIRG